MSRARDNANLGAQAGSGLDASDITSGVLPVGVTGGSGLNALSASNLSAGTVPDARFPATLPATSGTNLTALPAANVTGALPAAVTGGSGLTLGGTVGQISAFGVATAPTGWFVCNGASLARVGTYATLFSVIGTAWGTVDGNTFNVPDLRDEFLRGVSASLSLATAQDHQMMTHYHWMQSWAGQGGDGSQNPHNAGYGASGPYGNSIRSYAISKTTTATDTSNIGSETRPQNITVQWCIKF